MASKAIISLAGKQHFVAAGDQIKVDKHVDQKVGETFVCDQVLLTVTGDTVKVGAPTVKGAQVTLEVINLTKGPKVVTARFQAKSRYRKTTGHRQPLSELKVVKVD